MKSILPARRHSIFRKPGVQQVNFLLVIITVISMLSACISTDISIPDAGNVPKPKFPTSEAVFTPIPARPPYEPGQQVDYTAQMGDTIPALAVRFNTKAEEILAANTFIPKTTTTMPPGMPMKIPIYFKPLWGTPYQIIPDSLFIDGPADLDFDLEGYISSKPGWLGKYREGMTGGQKSVAEVLRVVADNFSVSPLLMLAILNYTTQGLTDPVQPNTTYILGYVDQFHQGLYMQLVWLANALNNGYYAYRRGALTEFETTDGHIERPDPWQNAGTVAIQTVFAKLYPYNTYEQMIGPGGLAETYAHMYGAPWKDVKPHLPGSLEQPSFILPFEPGRGWNLTGGPHTGWGKGEPYTAIDFAPNGIVGCAGTNDWVTAVADGLIAESDTGYVWLDLDGDGKLQTGWSVYYLHISSIDRVAAGTKVKQGDHIGHPSCEGGEATGTHVHIARKYNGEWMIADSVVPFNLEGWVVRSAGVPYYGSMVRYSKIVTSSEHAEGKSYIISDR